jgi:hypothetical protein
MVTRKALALLALAACGKFQDPDVVVDLRVIAMTASLPEQIVKLDFTGQPTIADVLAQLQPSDVCALVADPNFDGRRLRWSMTLCPQTSDDRCDSSAPQAVIGSGLLDDPDITVPEPRMCATVMPDANLAGIVLAAFQSDPLMGLQGEQYEVMLEVGGEDADPALDQYAAKALQVTPDLPAGRTPNHNPYLTEIDATLPDADPVALALGRCIDQAAPLEVAPATKIRFTPVEPDGVRETYTIEKLDGTFETFTESLTYQWTAGAGSFSAGTTGGPHDVFGNSPPLFTDWTAPAAKDLDGPTDVPLWIVQRDERLGAAWYESCIRVVPSPQ